MTQITLSFDNGPDPDVTPQVLDVLRRHDIRTTFFVLGDKLRERRYLCERAHGEGHAIGNHTYNHLVPLGMSAAAGMATFEIVRTQELIGTLAHERRFFRPFGGGGLLDDRLLNPEALDVLVQGGFTCVLWNAIPEDWVRPQEWVDRALQQCFSQAETLIVLHDIATGAMNQLDRFLNLAKDRGARFTQDFPESCVPIERGRILRPVDRYLSRAA
ncbi:polysaccharide deacetylase family protein [Methylobacterium isbiliense]|uniref:Chitooligosaccharide deacetylase n=1 Tax=Methylobacterium isbiliense TaxID=315478 RepID=A0ABQ4SKZ0_9HYPH|nr:polysaccharide deacetylase family protein [Methylobacterium isbiliense]MDN3626615.1 polysaccharide deacetylase family protein [Methylobacterium isbiliense]GJE03896.1 Peptidoglycan-N-acetylglucosamine deacetylase [Methylobacterium isbiliense]